LLDQRKNWPVPIRAALSGLAPMSENTVMAEIEFSVHGKMFKLLVQEPRPGSSDGMKLTLLFEGNPIWRKTVTKC
jgi:hypothetical protein